MSFQPSPTLPFALAGEEMLLLADRALFWPRQRTLFLADPHFGKGATFRQLGLAVPDDTAGELTRLTGLLAQTDARRLVILGDLLHARTGATSVLFESLGTWRSRLPNLEIILIRGNHDRHAGDPPEGLGIMARHGPLILKPFACSHEPVELPGYHVLAGHLHPSFRLHDRQGISLCSPCFWGRPGCSILPAFGSFTGTQAVHPEPGDRIFLLGPGQIMEVNS